MWFWKTCSPSRHNSSAHCAIRIMRPHLCVLRTQSLWPGSEGRPCSPGPPGPLSLALPGHPGCTPTQAGTGASGSLAPGASSYPKLPSPSRCPFCAHVAVGHVLNPLPLQRAHVADTTLKTFFPIPSSLSMEGLKMPLRQVSLKSEHASIEGSVQETPLYSHCRWAKACM